MIIYDYAPTGDSLRFLNVATEYGSFDLDALDPLMNCHTAPGYPLLLLLIRSIAGHSSFLIAIAQSLLFAASLWLLLLTLRERAVLKDQHIPWAFGIALFSPEIFVFNSFTLSESFTATLVVTVVAACLRPAPSLVTTLLLLISATWLFLTRFEYLFILPAILYVLLKDRRWMSAGSLVVVVLFCFHLNALKNEFLYDRYNPFSFGGGTVMYGGNNQNLDGSWHVATRELSYLPKDAVAEYLDLRGRPVVDYCVEQDAFFKRLAIQAWKEDPFEQLLVIPTKFMKLWLIPARFDPYSGQQVFKKGLQLGMFFDDSLWPWYAKYKHAFYILIHWVLLGVALFGFGRRMAALGWRGADRYDMLAIYCLLGASCIYSVPFYGLGRFHVPVFPLLIIYAAYVVMPLFDKAFSQGREDLGKSGTA
jgi:hypothetical protein